MKASSLARKVVTGALCAAASALTASATPLNIKLVDAGNPAETASSITIDGVTKKDVYIGPYTLSINGVDTAAMCIDFNIASNVGDTYTAYGTMVGSSDLSKTYSPRSGQEYEEEAYLFSQIVKPNADRKAIQTAAWDIMAYDITNISYFWTDRLGDNPYIDAALANYKGMSGLYEIISDTSKYGEQEFIVDPSSSSSVTPEPSSFVLMLAPALFAGAEAVRRRRLGASLLG